MKTYNNLYDKICSFENIYSAYLKARKGKRYHNDVIKFSINLEENLISIRDRLVNKTYHTGKYKHFTIYEPKERKIAALPFEDRIVQHSICNIIEPLFEKSFIYDSHACRKGFGVISGSLRTTKFRRAAVDSFKNYRIYCLKGDIKKYFYSIDHSILKKLIRKRIRCSDTINLLEEIIDSSESLIGIPIGNLTSQIFANIYLNEFDHYIKDVLRIKYYIRYMDDFIILHPDKRYLKAILSKIEKYFKYKLALDLNSKTQIFLVNRRAIDFLGYIVFYDHRLLRKGNVRRTKRKFKKFQKLYYNYTINLNSIRPSIMSWLGHTKWSDSFQLVEKVLDATVFVRSSEYLVA